MKRSLIQSYTKNEGEPHCSRNGYNFLMENSTLQNVLGNIYNAIVNLPKPIRRVCYVQIFAFMGW